MRPKLVTIDGRTQTLAQWASECGIAACTMRTRLRQGLPLMMERQGVQAFPEREWLKRNLEMLNKAPDPDAYLRGVAVARGDTFAENLRRARDSAKA